MGREARRSSRRGNKDWNPARGCGKLGAARRRMAPLDTRNFPPVKIPLLIGLAVALMAGQLVTPRQDTPIHDAKTRDGNTSIPPEYVCLDAAVRATAPDGGTI